MKESAGAAGVTTNSQLETYYRWVEPDSDITVRLKPETADRLQREVLRGIESCPGAGNEVGGILLGRTEIEEGRILTFVDDFEPVPSEHRNGPSYPFVLTAKDVIGLEAALARRGTGETPSVVGYYRSHNRGGLFLSTDDLRLIHRYFRGPDNLFLLVKTLPDGACTAGFFFWKDGHVQSQFTGSEAPLNPLSLSSAGRSLLLGEAADGVPSALPAPVLPAGEEPPAMAPPDSRRSRYRLLIRDLAVMGAAAAVAFAVLLYRETGPARQQTPSAPQTASPAAAGSAPPTPAPVRAPDRVVEQSAPYIPSPPEKVRPQARNWPATRFRDEPKLPVRAPAGETPVRETPARETPAVRSRADSEPGTPPSSKPLTATAEHPLNTPAPAVERMTAPPAVKDTNPAAPPPVSGNPVTPASPAGTSPAPRTETTTKVVPPISTPVPPDPPASPSAGTFAGPQVMHPVTPAVPRGVGPMITTDVQVDVAVAIDANGKVTSARVASTKGTAAGLLTIEALKAAQLFRFRPARENNRNVASSMVLTFRFARTAK